MRNASIPAERNGTCRDYLKSVDSHKEAQCRHHALTGFGGQRASTFSRRKQGEETAKATEPSHVIASCSLVGVFRGTPSNLYFVTTSEDLIVLQHDVAEGMSELGTVVQCMPCLRRICPIPGAAGELPVLCDTRKVLHCVLVEGCGAGGHKLGPHPTTLYIVPPFGTQIFETLVHMSLKLWYM